MSHNLGHFTNKMSRSTNNTHPAFRSSQAISQLKYLGGDAPTLGHPAKLLGPQTLYIFYLVWQQWPLNKPFSVALNASTIMQSCTLIDSTFFSVCRSQYFNNPQAIFVCKGTLNSYIYTTYVHICTYLVTIQQRDLCYILIKLLPKYLNH